MALAFNVKIGDTIEMEHAQYGYLGTFRLDQKTGNAVRLIFDMPRAVLIRVMNHRSNGVTWGLSATPRAPLKAMSA